MDLFRSPKGNFPEFFFFPDWPYGFFNSGFLPLPGDHMVRAGVGVIGRYGTLA